MLHVGNGEISFPSAKQKQKQEQFHKQNKKTPNNPPAPQHCEEGTYLWLKSSTAILALSMRRVIWALVILPSTICKTHTKSHFSCIQAHRRAAFMPSSWESDLSAEITSFSSSGIMSSQINKYLLSKAHEWFYSKDMVCSHIHCLFFTLTFDRIDATAPGMI